MAILDDLLSQRDALTAQLSRLRGSAEPTSGGTLATLQAERNRLIGEYSNAVMRLGRVPAGSQAATWLQDASQEAQIQGAPLAETLMAKAAQAAIFGAISSPFTTTLADIGLGSAPALGMPGPDVVFSLGEEIGAIPIGNVVGPALNVTSGIYNLLEGNTEQGAGTLAGTAAGAALGSIIPGIGTLLGASIGGGAGSLLGSIFGEKDGEEKKPSAAERSMAAGQAAAGAYSSALSGTPADPGAILRLLNTQWAPHGELQTGWSTAASSAYLPGHPGYRQIPGVDPLFGQNMFWAGDYDDRASPAWIEALGKMTTPSTYTTDPEFVKDFIAGLWVQGPGQTGAVPFNWPMTESTITKFASALPDLPVYTEFKGGLPALLAQRKSLAGEWDAEQWRIGEERKRIEEEERRQREEQAAGFYSWLSG